MVLKKLCQMGGVSGDEECVAEFIVNEIKPYADKITIDVMGNVIAFVKGESSDKKVMVAAHMDEVGFIISAVTDDGYLKFKTVGGIDERVLPGKRVKIGECCGVIGIKAIHLQSKQERESVATEDKFVIDIGAKSRKEAEEKVNIGDYAWFDSKYCEMGEGKIMAKAIDDRAGCAIMIELVKQRYYYDTYFCFTVQEEVGTRGAQITANRILPDAAIVLEATTCSDVSGVPSHMEVTTNGGGAALSILDRGSYSDADLTKKLYELAEKKNIAVQYKRTTAGGNDARVIQVAGSGVKTAAVSVPCRYLHSPVGLISKSDYEAVKKLTLAFLLNAKEILEN